ncbi:MAG: ABC transporter ATP-binding protein [Cyclobacteriaceae bacterium]|nr:ABC transporter ATP-binding protein [Cyclobacteriaceae bacterium]MCX7637912.1 ABC transporter ATP-binding protein [Cyclobacteriaceae bacterium]MDW8331901.1 ABC transporter ATP-binding protein [Cyclobacteriaceae bacterium]
MVQAEEITKSYGTLRVLRGVSLSVKKGEVVAVVGASGAGKSTLLHILGTLDLPDGGHLMINGTDVLKMHGKSLASFRNRSIGFVFQFHNLLPEFSALENVMIPGLIAKEDEKRLRERAVELLTMLGLGERLTHKPAALSGGEQQRTAVARALINNPALILADEPSGNLDSKNAHELHRLFFDLREKLNQTFVIVTHNPEFAAMADRKLEIRDGVIIS